MKTKKNFLKKLTAGILGFVMTLGVGAAGYSASASETHAATTTTVSAGDFYIGATTGSPSTNYYLQLEQTTVGSSVKGTAVTDKNEATIFTFAGSGTTWTIKIKTSGNYMTLLSGKDNGKVVIQTASANWTSSLQNNKLRLAANSSYSLQKNNGGTQFGSYGNTQTDLWLEPAGTKKISSIAVSGTPTTTTYNVGDSFDTTGLVVTATYEDSTTGTITEGISWKCNPSTFATKGTVSVKVTASVDTLTSPEYTVNNIIVNAAPPIITITRDDFTEEGDYSEISEWTKYGVSGGANIYSQTTSGMQFNKGSGLKIGGIWNTVAVPGAITKITAKKSSGTDRAWNAWVYSSPCSYNEGFVDGANKTKINSSAVTVSTSEVTIGESDAGYSYFFIEENVNSSTVIGEFKIYYTPAQEYDVTATTEHCSSDGTSTCNTGEDYVANITPNDHYDLVSVSQVKSNNIELNLNTDYTWSDNKLTIKKSAIKGDITYKATGSKSPKTVSLSNDSEHVSLSSSAGTSYHSSYSVTIKADTGYVRPASVSVKMGGSDFTDFSYTQATGSFSIAENLITGNIEIKAVATAEVYTLDISGLENITCEEDAGSSKSYGGSFSATLNATQGYTLNNVTITVTMGGNPVSGAYTSSNHKVEIKNVTGNIAISGSAEEVVGPSIELSKYESEFEYLSNDTVSFIVANATVTGISASLTVGNDVASFALDDDHETINISSTSNKSNGIGYYDLIVNYIDDGGESGSKTFNDFGVQVNRHTALSFSLANATSEQSSTTSYEYGDEFDIEIVPNQYYTLEDGDIVVMDGTTDITEDVLCIEDDGSCALISLEDEYDSVSITVNATRLPAYVTRIDITTPASTLSFKVGATFNHNGIAITGTNNDGTSAGIVTSLCSFSSPDMLNAGQKTVTITLINSKGENVTTSYTITITETALLDGGLSSCGWTSSHEQSKVYDDLELTQSNVGTWALSSGEQYSNSTMFVLGDFKTSHGAWNNFSSHENMKSLANGLVKNNLVLKESGNPIGRYGAIITKDFNISRFYKAEIAWGAFISGGTNNNVYIMGTKDGGVTWDKLAEKTKVSAGASAADTLTWNNTSKYSANDKVFIAIVYTATSEVTTTNSPAIRNLTWKLYGDSLNKNEKWNVIDFSLSKTSSTLKVGDEETLKISQKTPSFAQDTFTWSSDHEDVVTVNNGEVTAVGEGEATVTVTSSQNISKACTYTVGPADIHVTGVSIKYNDEVVTTDSIQERSTRTYVADVQPADATDKSVTWSISEISPAGCASINSSTGEVTASAAGSAKITVTTTDGSKSASCVITITAYPSYNIVYKAGDGTGADITDKYDYDKDATARAANTFTAPNGKKFDHWLGSDTNTYNAGAAISKLSSGSTLTLTAVYVADTYTITYLDQGGNAYSGSTISSPISYTFGEGATLPTVSKDGFSFGGWYADSACSGSPVTSISTSDYGNKTFYAKWTFNSQTNLDDVQKSIGMAYKPYEYDPTVQPFEGYEKASSIAVGDTVIFVAESATRELTGISNTTKKYGIASTYSEEPAASYVLNVVAGSKENTYAFKHGNDYLHFSGSDNTLNTSTTLDNNTSWTIEFDEYDFMATNAASTNRKLQYNSQSGQERFACYTTNQTKFQVYKYVETPAKYYKNVDFRFNLKFNGIQTFAKENNVDSDYGLVVSYSGRTRYFSVKNKQVLEEGKDPVSLEYKGTADNGYFTIRLGDKGDVLNDLTLSQVKYKVQVYAQDSSGTKYVSNTFVEYSVQSLIEEYYNNPYYCTQAVQDLYAILGPTTKGE